MSNLLATFSSKCGKRFIEQVPKGAYSEGDVIHDEMLGHILCMDLMIDK